MLMPSYMLWDETRRSWTMPCFAAWSSCRWPMTIMPLHWWHPSPMSTWKSLNCLVLTLPTCSLDTHGQPWVVRGWHHAIQQHFHEWDHVQQAVSTSKQVVHLIGAVVELGELQCPMPMPRLSSRMRLSYLVTPPHVPWFIASWSIWCSMRLHPLQSCTTSACRQACQLHHCSIFNVWMLDEKTFSIVPTMGFIMSVGLRNTSISLHLFNSHNWCKKGKFKMDCPICQEYLFTSCPVDMPFICDCFLQLAVWLMLSFVQKDSHWQRANDETLKCHGSWYCNAAPPSGTSTVRI